MYYLEVYIEHENYALNATFLYASDIKVERGSRVSIEFNFQENIVGFVDNSYYEDISIEEKSKQIGFKIKKINYIIDKNPIITPEFIELAHKISEKYYTSVVKVLKTMLPDNLKPASSYNNKVNNPYVEYIYLDDNFNADDLEKNEKKFIEKFKKVDDIKYTAKLKNNVTCSKLIEKGIIKVKSVLKNEYTPLHIFDKYKSNFELTSEQNNALEKIKKSTKPVLLKGVTGSGKTEIYIKIAEFCKENEKSALILVPEIALTTLMVDRFYAAFKEDEIYILHSKLKNYEKYIEYSKIKNSKKCIVIGTRSAIFAPINNLGAIIIDECHDHSYIQNDIFSYSAIDVAFLRKKDDVKIILGSATPTVEQSAMVLKNKMELVELNHSFVPSKIKTYFVNRNDYKSFTMSPLIFSDFLIQKIIETISLGHKIILLINNKGYSRSYFCRSCGHVFKCPHCGLTLAYSYKDKKLFCSQCDYKEDLPTKCPHCESTYFMSDGFGIEKVEEEFKKVFPSLSYSVLDGDIVKTEDINILLNDFEKGATQVLIGTQIVSKGHDFSNVGLMGILNADIFLNLPSYKSNEYTFNLIHQALGRIGRDGTEATCVIQTLNPNNPVINFASQPLGYNSFLKYELKNRQMMQNPPYFNIVSINMFSKDKEYLLEKLHEIKNEFRKISENTIRGPSLAYRFRGDFTLSSLEIKYKNISEVKDFLNYVTSYYSEDNKIRLFINFFEDIG